MEDFCQKLWRLEHEHSRYKKQYMGGRFFWTQFQQFEIITKSRRQRLCTVIRKQYSLESVTELLQCQWSKLQLWQQTIAAQLIITTTPNVCKPSCVSMRTTFGWSFSSSALRNTGTNWLSLLTNMSNSFPTFCSRGASCNKQTCRKLNVHSSSRTRLPTVAIQSKMHVAALTTSPSEIHP